MAKTSNTNYLRLYLLNNDVGASALREVFTKRVQESFAKGNVVAFLQYFKANIDVLNKKRIISLAAYQQLFPTKRSDVDINQWDVSLLSTILLYCCCLKETLDTLKKVLTAEVGDVDTYLNTRKATIEKLRDVSKLTDEQYEILFPSFPFTDLNMWDGNLLLCILLNLCKQHIVKEVRNILRDVIKQSVVLSVGQLDVKAFLKKVKVKIKGMRNKCVITSAQFEMLFPENGEPTDVYKWDDELLCIVVLQVCCQFPEEIVDAIKTVRRFRNEILAHSGNAEIDDKQFQDKWKLLENAIRKLLKGIEYKMNKDIEKKIKEFHDGPLAIEPTITNLIKQYARDQDILLVLGKIQTEMETVQMRTSQTNATINEILDEIQLIRKNQPLEHVRQIYGFKLKLQVSGNTKENADEAERILKAHFENPTKHRTDRYDPVGEAVQSVAIGLHDHGTTIQDISTGSVILDLQCDSLAGLNKFIQYYTGEQLQHSLNKVQRLLQKEFSCDLQITMRIPDDDLRKLLSATVYQRELCCKQEKHEDGFRRSMNLHLESSSLDGMCGVLEMFNSGDIANKFDKISEALSERLGQPVSITSSLDYGAFKYAIQSAARQPDLIVPWASGTGKSSSTSREDEQFPITMGDETLIGESVHQYVHPKTAHNESKDTSATMGDTILAVDSKKNVNSERRNGKITIGNTKCEVVPETKNECYATNHNTNKDLRTGLDEALSAEQYAKTKAKPLSFEEADLINRIISKYTNDPHNLMTKHSNLEMISASKVKSTKIRFEEEVCIVLYCRSKSNVPTGEEMFPRALYDSGGKFLNTDVREGYFMLCPTEGGTFLDQSTDWKRELAMGHSIGTKDKNISATCGVLVRVEDQPPYNAFLTVSHLFRNDLKNVHQAVGENVMQPAKGELACNQHIPDEDRTCGTVKSCIFDTEGDVGIDAALVYISENRMPTRPTFVQVSESALDKAGFSVDNYPKFDDGSQKDIKNLSTSNGATDRVVKFGKTTGLTKGTLRLHQLAVKISDVDLSNDQSTYLMKGQVEIDYHALDNIFFQAGDSGAAVFQVDKDNKLHIIGMAIGMTSYGTCVVTPIDSVLRRLQTELNVQITIRTFDTKSDMEIE